MASVGVIPQSATLGIVSRGVKASASVTLVAWPWTGDETLLTPVVGSKTVTEMGAAGAASLAAAAAIVGAYVQSASGSVLDYVGTVGQVMSFRTKTEGSAYNGATIQGTLISPSYISLDNGVDPVGTLGTKTIGSATEYTLLRLRGAGTEAPMDFKVVFAGEYSGGGDTAVDNVCSWIFNGDGKALNQPIYEEPFESRWIDVLYTPIPEGQCERHGILTSLDRLTTIRLWSWVAELDSMTWQQQWSKVNYFWILNPSDVNVFALDAVAGTLTVPTYVGAWGGTAIPTAKGGTNWDSSAANGVPSINAGIWQVNAITLNAIPRMGGSNSLVDSALKTLDTGEMGLNVAPASGCGARIMLKASESHEHLYLEADPTVDAVATPHYLTWYLSRGGGVAGYAGRIYSQFDTDANDGGRVTLVSFDASANPVDTLSIKNGYVGIGPTATTPGATWRGGCVEIRHPTSAINSAVRSQLLVLDSATSQAADAGGRIDFGGWRGESVAGIFRYAGIKGAAEGATGDGGYLVMFVMDSGGTLVEAARFTSAGVLRVASLAGSGSRAVVADASGNLSAP